MIDAISPAVGIPLAIVLWTLLLARPIRTHLKGRR